MASCCNCRPSNKIHIEVPTDMMQLSEYPPIEYALIEHVLGFYLPICPLTPDLSFSPMKTPMFSRHRSFSDEWWDTITVMTILLLGNLEIFHDFQ